MTPNLDEIERLARAATQGSAAPSFNPHWPAFSEAANPAAVLAVIAEVKRLREALVVAKTIPDLQREVMMAPMGDRLASANTALREAYQRLAALEPRA